MHVFKDGKPWTTVPVSTGRRGKATPSGIFPVLQKSVFHRSNIYSNAPMPYMQRLTWSGIAIHAGHLPGYPASHGCIRLPYAIARSLYALTRPSSTTVIVTNEPIRSSAHAQRLALAFPVKGAASVQRPAQNAFAVAPTAPLPPPETLETPAPDMSGQTIQLAASATSEQAAARWDQLISSQPELAGYRMAIIPAVVNSKRVFRLRASAPQAHAACSRLRTAGVPCFPVS